MIRSEKRNRVSEEDWQTIRRIVSEYVKPHTGPLALAVVLMILLSAATGALAWIVGPTMEQIFEEKNPGMLTILPIAVLVIMLVRAGSEYSQAKILNFMGQKIVADLQKKLFHNMIHADLMRLNTIHSSAFISNFLYDTDLVRSAVTTGITGIGQYSLTLLFLIGVMFYRDWTLTLAVLLILPILLLIMRQLRKRMRKATLKVMHRTSDLSRIVSETLRGARIVKAYSQEGGETARAARTINERLKQLMGGTRARIRAAPITEAATGFAVFGVLVYAGRKALNNQMTAAEFTSFLTAMMLAYQPAKALSQLSMIVTEGVTAAHRILSIFDVKPKIINRMAARELDLKQGKIQFENVYFDYSDGTSALKGVDFNVPAGKTVALVGPSGGGKTTIFNLIPRFYDAKTGRVVIDGQDVRDVTIASLRKAMAIVTQEPFLFDDTVCANIAYGRPSSSDEQIVAAAEAAAAHEFIVGLPKQYDTVVGESGVKLSGGQRQRLVIARAMLADTPILLLDEATSSLDNESERQVQAALRRLMKDRTTLVIAHRTSTIIDADKIIVIDAGRVIEQGNHAELLKRQGLYASLYQTQFESALKSETPAIQSKQAAGE